MYRLLLYREACKLRALICIDGAKCLSGKVKKY